jgi:hypothetical protein
MKSPFFIKICFILSSHCLLINNVRSQVIVAQKFKNSLIYKALFPKDSLNLPFDVEAELVKRNSRNNFSASVLALSEPATFTGNPPWENFQFVSKNFNVNKEWQKKPFMIEADMKLNFELWSFSWKGLLLNAHFEPRIMLRMFQNDTAQKDESFAVRTPSYFPLGTINFTTKHLWNKSRSVNHFFSLKTWHHSNGQDGLDFDEKGWFNTRNGDFADILGNEFGYTIFKRKTKAHDLTNAHNYTKKNQNRLIFNSKNAFWVNIGYEHHWKKWVTGRLTRYQLFGLDRANLNLGWRKSNTVQPQIFSNEKQTNYPIGTIKEVEQFKATLKFAFIMDKNYFWGPMEKWQAVKSGDLSKRLNAVASFYYHPHRFKYFGIFAQGGYYGSDPYNAYFQQSMWFYKVGFSTGLF